MFKKIISFTSGLMAKKTLPWANEIDSMMDLVALEHTTKQLVQDLNNGLFDDHQQLEAFLSIDEKTHVIAERVAESFVETEHIDLDYEAHIANVSFLYHRQTYNTYLKLIKHTSALPSEVYLIMLLRACNSATEMIKWRFYQFQSAPANIWSQLAKLYLLGEDKFLHNEATQLYPTPENELADTDAKDKTKQKMTTLSQAYMKACMIGSLETLSFKAPQIDLVCKILNTWAHKHTIDREFDPQKHLFLVDFGQNVSAKRIRKHKASTQQRYWSFDSVNSKIELCLSLLEFNITPKQPKIIEITKTKHALATLSVLRSEWCKLDANSQRRSAVRINTSRIATINYGFDSICDRVSLVEGIIENNSLSKVVAQQITSQTTKNVTQTLAPDNINFVDNTSESNSSIVDESNKGVGLHIKKQASELSMGMLVGISANDKSFDHKIGVIRNIKPVTGNQLHIGVELLCRTIFAAEGENLSSQYENTASANEFSDSVTHFSHDFTRFTCLFLPKAFSNQKVDTLIMPRHQFLKNNLYRVVVSGKSITIKPSEILEHHDNWVRISYTQAVI